MGLPSYRGSVELKDVWQIAMDRENLQVRFSDDLIEIKNQFGIRHDRHCWICHGDVELGCISMTWTSFGSQPNYFGIVIMPDSSREQIELMWLTHDIFLELGFECILRPSGRRPSQ